MAQSASHYSIPDENSARSAARLSEQYRAKLDAQRSRQQQQQEESNRVIDVRPSRVAIERDSSASARRSRSTQSQTPSASAEESGSASSRQLRRSRPATAEQAAPDATSFAYEPRALKSGVDLKSSPQARGVFVDLMA